MKFRLAERTGLTVVAFIALVAVLVCGAFAYSAWNEYRNMRLRAEQRATDASHTASEHIRWLVEASRQSLRHVDEDLPEDPGAFPAADPALLRDTLNWLPEGAAGWLVDAQGKGVVSTRPPGEVLEIGDTDHFRALRDGAPFAISRMLFGRLTGRAVFVVARRVERQGGFAGAALIVIPAETLASFYETLGVSRRSTIGILRDDGWMVMRYPLPDVVLNLADYVLFTDLLPRAPTGIYSTESPVDGERRIVAYRRISGLPLVNVVSISWDDQMAAFWTRMQGPALAAAAALAAVMALGMWAVRLVRRDSRTRHSLTAALVQNDLLLREVHHRVKNNLQIISGLVHLQSPSAQSKAELIRRIAAMSAVHEQIYMAGQFSRVDVPGYLRRVVEGVQSTSGPDVSLTYAMEPLDLEIEAALPLGLIASEAVANAIKHAFPPGSPGRIEVWMGRDGDAAWLEIADNGAGFNPADEPTGLGRRLIASLAGQLGGAAELTSGPDGTRVRVRFPVRSTTNGGQE
jgi:two-component sensor histidine kinase